MDIVRLRYGAVFLAALTLCGEFRNPLSADENQPLLENARRLLVALDSLGAPLPPTTTDEVAEALRSKNATAVQQLLDARVLFHVTINPELRVSVRRGAADPLLQQAGYVPVLAKIENQATVTRRLQVHSPQAGPPYSGAARGSLLRQAQTELNDNENRTGDDRFLSVEVFDGQPMTDRLSGHAVEYVVLLIYCSAAGQREATLVFDVGQGTQDVGFRSELPVLFTAQPAIPVRLRIADETGEATVARLEIRDAEGRVYPPQARRLAPDFFFQPQVYRADGETVLLPPGAFTVISSRGPEYRPQSVVLNVATGSEQNLAVKLERWVDPRQYGFYSGDHHIHGAGCSHYTSPTQGVTPADMFRQVKGEGLNVGCVLTWGPCFDHQRTFFSPDADRVSEHQTVLKYDLEISGFGSAALGHVCLLNLKNQTYPGSEGTSTHGWPTWTVPVLRWAKEQGGTTGYPHSALHVDPLRTAEWIMQNYDHNSDGQLDTAEAQGRLLPESARAIDADGNGLLTVSELQSSSDRAADRLPNLAVPALDGGGAMEIFVSTTEGVCDFISAMDTARIPEWNTWYHLLNCGFPMKVSGETDFPCMSSRRVGQGRVYVQLGEVDQLDFTAWCDGLQQGRSYVSDGYAHALKFTVNGSAPGSADVLLAEPGMVQIHATVAFAREVPVGVAYGTHPPASGRRMAGDTVNLHGSPDAATITGGERRVELIVNGQVVHSSQVAADGAPHDLTFSVPVDQSSWVALRQFPQLHTNPVNVLVRSQPIRASRASALWCFESVHRLWKNRQRFIAAGERSDARDAYLRSLQTFLAIAESVSDDSYRLPEMPQLMLLP